MGRPGWVRSSCHRAVSRREEPDPCDGPAVRHRGRRRHAAVDELRIVGQLELPPAVGLKAVRLPDAAYRAGADAGGLRHPSKRKGKGRNARGPRLVAQQSFEACRGEALLPAPHAGLGLAGLSHDLDGTSAVGAQQDDLGAPDALVRRIAVFDDSHQSLAIGWRNGEGYSCAHAPDLAFAFAKGNPSRTVMLGYVGPIPVGDL